MNPYLTPLRPLRSSAANSSFTIGSTDTDLNMRQTGIGEDTEGRKGLALMMRRARQRLN